MKGSVAMKLHGFASFHAVSLPKLPHHSDVDGEEEGQQRHAFLNVRILTQHCMSARSHTPSFYSSSHRFAACHGWATSADALVPTYRHTHVKADESFVQSQEKALER